MTSPRSAVALLALAACTDASPEPTPFPGPRTIQARDMFALHAATGATVEYPVDLDTAVVHAYVRDAAGAWTVYPGEGTSAGTLTVADTPAGPTWLRVDYLDAGIEAQPRNEYFFVDTSDEDVSLDLGTWRAGRSNLRHATEVPTELALKLSGLAPWQPGRDLAVITAPGIGFAQVFFEDRDGITGVPTANATASTLRADWASAVGGPLFDASLGDRAYALQMRFREIGGMFVGAVVRAAALPPFTQQNGMTTEVDAALGEPPQLRVQVAMDRDAFDALRPAIGRDVSPTIGRGMSISAATSSVSESFSRLSLPAELLVVEGDAIVGTGPFDLGAADIASPFPREHVFAHAASAYHVMVPRDDGHVAQSYAEVGVLTTELPTAGAPLAPLIGPVRNVTVGGMPAYSAPTGVGLTPELRWDPPALGTATEYEVRILAPGGADPTYDLLWYPAAIFHVPGDQTSLALPPEILIPDYPYAIAIRAITHAVAADIAARAPRQRALPFGWADTITPAFKP